ncbi:hypothetical protein ACLB1Q_05855 [Escherichia coli]
MLAWTMNIALEQVVTWDSDNIFTPNIFEHNGRCFMKKNETWMLLNGDATPNIRTMSNKKIECLEKSEVEWASKDFRQYHRQGKGKSEGINM